MFSLTGSYPSGRVFCLATGMIVVLLAAGAPIQAQPAADYGDAPDGRHAFYPGGGGMAIFPTLFATANSRVGGPGVHHLTTGQEWLGPMGSATSVEIDANDPGDPDGTPNLVGSDGFDDGLPPLPLTLILTSLPPQAFLTFQVSVAGGAPAVPRYVNVLIDWNLDGEWKNLPGQTPEWAIANYQVNTGPGASQFHTVPFTWGLGAQLAPQVFWMRITLSRTPLGGFGPDGWDGSGAFAFGETEDYLFKPGLSLSGQPIPHGAPPAPGGGTPVCRFVPNPLQLLHGFTGHLCLVCNLAGQGLPLVPRFNTRTRGTFGLLPSANANRRSPFLPAPGAPIPLPGGTTMTPLLPGALPPGACPPGTILGLQFASNFDPPFRIIKHAVALRLVWPGIAVKQVQGTVIIYHTEFGVAAFLGDLQMLGDMAVAAEDPELSRRSEHAFAQGVAALAMLERDPPQRIPAVARLQSAVQSIESVTAIDVDPDTGEEIPLAGLQGAGLMNDLVGLARILAEEAILEAQAAAGDPDRIARATEALAEGDDLRGDGLSEDFGVFEEAIRRYRQAIVQAQASHD